MSDDEMMTSAERRAICASGVGPGWRPLVERIDREVEALAPGYRVDQVKEKFGTLRFYFGNVPEALYDQVEAIVDAGEAESGRICEDCGKPGTTAAPPGRRFGWVRTLCPECRTRDTERNTR